MGKGEGKAPGAEKGGRGCRRAWTVARIYTSAGDHYEVVGPVSVGWRVRWVDWQISATAYVVGQIGVAIGGDRVAGKEGFRIAEAMGRHAYYYVDYPGRMMFYRAAIMGYWSFRWFCEWEIREEDEYVHLFFGPSGSGQHYFSVCVVAEAPEVGRCPRLGSLEEL